MSSLLTVNEAAALLNLSPATLRYWRHAGTGPESFKVGPKRVMYRREDLDRWLQAQYDGRIGA